MAIADQLTQLSQVKADIKQALIAKGGAMDDVPFTGYAEKIAGIKTGVERTYLFKDGVLDPRINLPAGITNNGEYLVNSGGNIVMPFTIPEVIGKKLFIKCMHTGGLATNQYFLIWERGIPQQKYIKCIFDGGNILNQLVFLGYDYSNSPETATEQISFTGNANTMRIYEIWYE